MLKIGKGLKKKKKNKKGKGKNDELFTEAELAQYKKEKAEQAAAAEAAAAEGTPVPGASEEFEKFKLLTAGVDDILRKSQGDLDRIKKDSFFQRKPTPSELKALEDKERAEREKSEGNWIGFEEGQNSNQREEVGEESHFEEEDSESEFEDNDDIFNTAYVEALESGEVKLAHIPDDDELGFNDGPDPFDTTTADQLLRKVEEEERKKKKEISLGLAVNVLTGRAERDRSLIDDSRETEVKKQVRARPRKIQDFCLLGSFDSEGVLAKEVEEAESAGVSDFPKSLLDEELFVDEDLPEGDILITQVLVKQVAKPPPPELATPPEGEDLTDIVSEFESSGPVVDPEIKKLEEEEEFDEFSALAASSIVNQKLEEQLQQFEPAEDDPFDTSLVNSVLQKENDLFDSIEGQVKAPVTIPQAQNIDKGSNWSDFDNVPQEIDPFDTAFAENCAPGKAELRLLEREILDAASAGNPIPKTGDIQWEARILSRNNSGDFNPREGEEAIKVISQRVSIHITDPSGETQQRGSESEDITAVTLNHRDLLGGSTTDLSGLAEEVLPLSSTSPSQEVVIRYSDPFDTSLADQASAPGQAELRFIEKELLSDIPDVLSDEDFDPRAGDDGTLAAQKVSFDIPSPAAPDLLSSVREGGGRPLTPYYADPLSASAESDIDIELEDPFDTSHVTSLPGKLELKLIEQELSSVPVQNTTFQPILEKLGIDPESEGGGLKRSVSDENFNPRADEPRLSVVQPTPRRFSDVSGLNNPPGSLPVRVSFVENKPDLLAVEEELPEKTLTPAVEEDITSYIDPFDTSIAENIAPGQAELKVLEVELVGSIARSYTDPDFNPRDTPVPVPEGRLKTVPSTKPLTPIDLSVLEDEEIDPFDTSIAANLVPGRAELRLLESELVTQ